MADEAQARVVMQLVLETKEAERQLDTIEKSRDDMTVKVDADTTAAQAAVDALTVPPEVLRVDADTSAARAAVDALTVPPEVLRVDADTTAAQAAVDALTVPPEVVRIDADTSAAQAAVDALTVPEHAVTLDTTHATAAAEALQQRIDSILADTERSMASRAARIGQLFIAQGEESSAAMTRAWALVKGEAQRSAAQTERAVSQVERPLTRQGSLLTRLRGWFASLTDRARQFGTQGRRSGEQVNRSFSVLGGTGRALLQTLTSLFAVTRVIAWGRACVSASTEAENAFRGLSSILAGQGRDFAAAQGWLQDYVADGLVPLSNAVASYKNLAARGYDDTQIRAVMTALKDSAAYGRQASYSLGEAVVSATEGLKNENSVLVDNAGVTKNVAKMWDDYARSIGTTSASLTQQQKIQAEVNGILTETRFQTGDAARVAGTFSGQVSQLTANLTQCKAVVGDFLRVAVLPLVSGLNTAVRAATIFLQTIGDALGITSRDYGQTVGASIASGMEQATEQTDALTTSLVTAKAAQDALKAASFDNFNVIGGQETTPAETAQMAPSNAVGGGIGDMARGASDAVGQTDALRERVQRLADDVLRWGGRVKSWWEAESAGLTASLGRTADSIKRMFAAIGGSLSTVLTDGTGEAAAESVLRTFTYVSDTVNGLDTRFTVAWEDDGTGDRIIQNAADHLLVLLGTVEDVSRATADWSQTVDFSPLLRSFAGVQEALTPILGRLSGGVSWVWENVLLPFGSWAIEDALPASLDVLSGALDVLDGAAAALEPHGKWLWDEFISPIADWTGEIVVDGLEALADVLHDVGDWIREHPDAGDALWDIAGALGGIAIAVKGAALIGNFSEALAKLSPLILGESSVISSAFATVGAAGGVSFGAALLPAIVAFIAGWGIGSAIYDIMGDEVDAVLWPVFDQIVGFFDRVKYWTRISLDYIKEWISRIPEHIRQKAQEAYNNTLRPFEKIGEWAADRMGEIRSAFSVTQQWFGETFGGAVDNIKEKFSAVKGFAEQAWTDITSPFAHVADWFHETFSHAWERVLEVFSSGGSVFEGIEAGISSVFTQTVNGLIDGINGVLIDPFWNISEALRLIREWSIWLPWQGDWYPFEWLPSFEMPTLPRLAKGGLVSAPTLALVGDNPGASTDPEVVSPLSKLRDMLPEGDTLSAAKLDAVIRLLERLCALVGAIDPCVRLGDKDIYAASERGRRQFQKMRGI